MARSVVVSRWLVASSKISTSGFLKTDGAGLEVCDQLLETLTLGLCDLLQTIEPPEHLSLALSARERGHADGVDPLPLDPTDAGQRKRILGVEVGDDAELPIEAADLGEPLGDGLHSGRVALELFALRGRLLVEAVLLQGDLPEPEVVVEEERGREQDDPGNAGGPPQPFPPDLEAMNVPGRPIHHDERQRLGRTVSSTLRQRQPPP